MRIFFKNTYIYYFSRNVETNVGQMICPTLSSHFARWSCCKDFIKLRLRLERALMLHLKGIGCLSSFASENEEYEDQRNSQDSCCRKVPPILSQLGLVGFGNFKCSQYCSEGHPEGTESHIAAGTDSNAPQGEQN
jgi:hypothetical protein